ncbi:hypothetical protein [Puia sp.]|jgi:hypothetical protein|uniref:hypothetical protein n=1 Tax=Puia sp. TaxID=2045100 RepID=UPI002F406179
MEEPLDTDLLRKQLKTVRIFLFIMAAVSFASAIIFVPDPYWRETPVGMPLTLLVALIYFLLALWARKKPYTAILIGLALILIIPVSLVLLHLAAFVHWPSKIIGIILLGLGVGDARDAQKKLRSL